MESSEPKQMIDLHAAAVKLTFFLRGKIHADGLIVRQIESLNSKTKPGPDDVLSLDRPQCWWMPATEGAVAVLVAPIRHVWHTKHKAALNLPDWDENMRSVWFAHLNTTGIPVPVSHMGLVNKDWTIKTPLHIIHLEEGESNAIKRAQANWGNIAFGCWAVTLLDTTTVLHEKLETPTAAG